MPTSTEANECVWCDLPLRGETRNFGGRWLHVRCYNELGGLLAEGERREPPEPDRELSYTPPRIPDEPLEPAYSEERT